MDEAHNLKGEKSQITRALTPALQAAGHVALLTSSPMRNLDRDLFNIIQSIRPELADWREGFNLRYSDILKNGNYVVNLIS